MSTASQSVDLDAVSAPAPALELRAIKAGYGRTVVLRDVSMEVSSGGVTALLGPNGAGKTTLLKVASGLLRPLAGEIVLGGLDVTHQPAFKRAAGGLCLIPEGRGIFKSLSVRDNLRVQLPPWRAGHPLDAAIEAFPILAERLDQQAGSMSGGQQQMLAVARAYLSDPRVVLLDEVSMGLAPRVVDEIFDSLKALAGRGTALVIVEQYVERALDLADRVVVLAHGAVSFNGPTRELDEATLLRAYLGADPPTEAAHVPAQ